ncbi:PRC-barrel domain-containing protein, partial [Candidatus Pacearchaeota archaeon]|nr:PRC-barrel domain-containing protein [Candidatus Pacearchaeota archaeon]
KKVFLFIGISGVIGAVLFLFKLNITGGAIGVGNFVKNNWIFESVILIVLVLGFIIILEKTKKRKIKDTTKLSNTKGMLVYSSDGDKIGKIKEIYLDNNNHKIDKWLICVDKEIAKKIKKKNILIKHESVKSIKEIMIVDGRISEHLETFKE